MRTTIKTKSRVPVLLALSLILAGFVFSACGQTAQDPTPSTTSIPTPTLEVPTATAAPVEAPTPAPTKKPPTPTATKAAPTAEPIPTEPPEEEEGELEISFEAASVSITIDGDTSDWSAITPIIVPMEQIGPIPGVDMGQVDPLDADLRVAIDSERIYVLVEIPDDFDYVADDHGLSPAMAVQFRIDDPAAPHMGSTEEDLDTSLGKVDIWHWELDCGPGEISGGNSAPSGNDPQCNLDDEWATTPEDREDDGTTQAENSLEGVWDHTGRSNGDGASGKWIFEMSRLLQTGDPDDAQLVSGGKAYMALAYWDPDETDEGWTDAGHLQTSSTAEWIEVTLP